MLARLVPVALLLTACSGAASSTSSPPPEAAPSTDETSSLALTCTGKGSPTVVLEAGLNTSGDTFAGLADELSATTRVCSSDRAGVGASAPLADDAPDPWPGSSADALAAALESSGEAAPYVVLGWSYGGMVAQAFATRHADVTAGLVLEDSSVPEQFTGPEWEDIDWIDGGRTVDEDTAVAELSTIDLGDLPTVVLSSDELAGRLRTLWYRYHDRLAASSTDAVHVEAIGSSHAMHESAPDAVVAAVEAVVAAVRAGTPLGDCRATFRARGERCLEPTAG